MSYTPSAKRKLNFGPSPYAKRRKTMAYIPQPYRVIKPEMKHVVIPLVHAAAGSIRSLTAIASGADNGQRVGNKIRIYNIEYVVSGGTPFSSRLDLCVGNDATLPGAPIVTFDTALDRQAYTSLKTRFMNNGSASQAGFMGFHKIPGGLLVKYGGPTAASVNSNNLLANVATPSSATLSGYFRIWYTDA